MLHKAWNSKGEMPYCFPRSSIKFQGHTGQNITDFDPNWAFPDYRPVAAFKSLRFALLLWHHETWFTGISKILSCICKSRPPRVIFLGCFSPEKGRNRSKFRFLSKRAQGAQILFGIWYILATTGLIFALIIYKGHMKAFSSRCVLT